MSKKSDATTIRFAVGSRLQPMSAPWRLWTNRSDIYMGVRMMLGHQKWSLHESGIWASAFTSESGASLPDESRPHRTWHRPEEFQPGWTLSPVISVPWVPWHADFAAISAYRAETVWTPGPSPGEKVTLSILIAGSDRHITDITEVLDSEERILGSLPLKNGERVWLRARKSSMQASEVQGVMSVQREAIGFGASSLDGIEPWLVWETTTAPPHQLPMLIHFPLGRHHFVKTG